MQKSSDATKEYGPGNRHHYHIIWQDFIHNLGDHLAWEIWLFLTGLLDKVDTESHCYQVFLTKEKRSLCSQGICYQGIC